MSRIFRPATCLKINPQQANNWTPGNVAAWRQVIFASVHSDRLSHGSNFQSSGSLVLRPPFVLGPRPPFVLETAGMPRAVSSRSLLVHPKAPVMSCCELSAAKEILNITLISRNSMVSTYKQMFSLMPTSMIFRLPATPNATPRFPGVQLQRKRLTWWPLVERTGVQAEDHRITTVPCKLSSCINTNRRWEHKQLV